MRRFALTIVLCSALYAVADSAQQPIKKYDQMTWVGFSGLMQEQAETAFDMLNKEKPLEGITMFVAINEKEEYVSTIIVDRKGDLWTHVLGHFLAQDFWVEDADRQAKELTERIKVFHARARVWQSRGWLSNGAAFCNPSTEETGLLQGFANEFDHELRRRWPGKYDFLPSVFLDFFGKRETMEIVARICASRVLDENCRVIARFPAADLRDDKKRADDLIMVFSRFAAKHRDNDWFRPAFHEILFRLPAVPSGGLSFLEI